MTDPFPASDFDNWAETYDQDVISDSFPFTGYQETLQAGVLAARAGKSRKLCIPSFGWQIPVLE